MLAKQALRTAASRVGAGYTCVLTCSLVAYCIFDHNWEAAIFH